MIGNEFATLIICLKWNGIVINRPAISNGVEWMERNAPRTNILFCPGRVTTVWAFFSFFHCTNNCVRTCVCVDQTNKNVEITIELLKIQKQLLLLLLLLLMLYKWENEWKCLCRSIGLVHLPQFLSSASSYG